ncbi:prolipoprotein diacylglyceryl transferase [Spiroplasma sabaudiense Ar-1343]|uniref:Prolipoprotein diacylglyceryl transferase n=1 Tax=Spiroplasma sabaudiense Ar-1343 TaxID=1276257 RepID=W6A8I1_9MOLU|nr:prolipoprotein diacylglyceryl transferase family protein [Spiroplasma sabaudiense]AHI53478.1 prolipoprotein diacylglyceryl transferase [Spiroplasma sabaudiense Ar-1343]
MVDWIFDTNEWEIWKLGWVQESYGWFRVYAFTMTTGVIVAIAFSAFKFWRKELQITHLGIGAVPIVIFSLFGGSFFGKLNTGGYDQNTFGGIMSLFAFWQPGMSIHGGVFVGSFVGIIIFYLMGRKSKVSVWTYMDAIIPNILLGQGIGRWGNFFNHEITGPPIALASENKLWWLPNFITQNTQALYKGQTGSVINGITLENGQLYQLNPIFVYEAFWLTFAWVVITFVLPNILKWFGKKPENINMSKLTLQLKEEYFSSFVPSNLELPFTGYRTWKFNRVFTQNISKYGIDNYHKTKADLDAKRQNKEISFIKYRWKVGKSLEEANNPYRFKVMRVGAEAGAYFFAWNFVRFILELQRPSNHLFIQHNKPLSLTLIFLTALVGIGMILFSQFVSPYLFRKPGYVFEKEYFKVIEVKSKKSKVKTSNKDNLKQEKAQEKLMKLKQKV